MPKSIETVLGFDYGKRWIGVAVGQTLTRHASALRAIKSNDWAKLKDLMSEWQPQILVVGYPLNMQDAEQEMSRRAARFSRQLEGRYGIPTLLVDERLTTREAHQIAAEQQVRLDKPEIDSLSAVLITESWLRDYNQNQSPSLV